jgi:cytochrome c-type biogenesis protein CcmH/NrfF
VSARTVIIGLCVHAVLAALAAVVLVVAMTAQAGAQQPPASDEALEAQALVIERQLLCPQCTNKRLDVCELPICRDMQRSIREQLQAGRHPEDILLYFRGHYGQRVLAQIPREGFNLALFGWTVGSVAAGGVLGGAYLLHLRRASVRTGVEGGVADEDLG